MPARLITTLAILGLLCGSRELPAQGPAERLFQDRVAKVFAARCVSCHNSVDLRGSLSLQKRDELRDSGVVEPGQPEESELFRVITSRGGKRAAMPKNGESLKPDEVAAIRDWIAAGAKWPDGFVVDDPVVDSLDWWSLQPLVRTSVPSVEASSADANWIRTPVDAFILQTLREQKLTHAAEADRRTLIRRLYFDLLGLPPTPAAVREFVADPDPRAFEALVDRLLESPQYGERWARHWLDVVKYADTCGYDKDKLRPQAWPYRDYVIRSFNDDKPYARFVQEQVAGDVLFPGTSDGILGLGFLAAGPWDFIGHVEVPEGKIDGKVARHTDRDEMVSSTLNTFCSATIQCCQCHNHKFDPFTQEHYYNLQAVFAAVDRADRPYDLDPSSEQRRQQLNASLQTAQKQLQTLDAAIANEGGAELAALEMSIRELQPQAAPRAKRPEFGYHSALSPQPNAAKWVQVDLGREVEITRVVLRPCHDDFAGIGAGFGFPVRFQITSSLVPESQTTLFDATGRDVPNPGLVPFEMAVDKFKVKTRFIRVTATKLALRQNDYMLALAELQAFDADGKNVALNAAVTSLDSIEAPIRWSRKNLTDGIWASAGDEAAIQQLAKAQSQRQVILARINTPERNQERDRLTKESESLKHQLAALPPGKMVYAAATQFAPQGNFTATNGTPRPVSLLHRGNVLQPRTPAVPGTLPILHSGDRSGKFLLPATHVEGDRRAALAQWLTRTDHPLTWRSIVNRVWQWHFGRGIVESPNDFGRMGRLPTHPALLDWLAAEFRDNGQSFKKLHRLIVLSSTYRQSSAHDEANARLDSDNRFLGRMNRRRLEAEEIRDAMLAVSGRLNPQMGGPGFYLFVLEQTAHSPHYEYHKFNPDEPASHRRSVYRFIVRSQPDPYMTTLDCADSSQSTPLRNETLTSLQALSLLNNGFSLSMSKHFAARLSAQSPSSDEQVRQAFELATGRAPTDPEREQLAAYIAQYGLPNLCRVLFNLSEFVYVD